MKAAPDALKPIQGCADFRAAADPAAMKAQDLISPNFIATEANTKYKGRNAR
ncbi:hypothetical protein [Streptomyces sp. NPDC059455]|uniref:hypothetical protein n=1 Tax=Streptomyces sp. NPDC059455 TaxID=3346837 RepID=UPI0036B0F4A3